VSAADLKDRRPIPARRSGWAREGARRLAAAGVTPNQISVFGVLVTVVCFALLVLSEGRGNGVRAGALIGAALCIPVRAACNMFDGMVAVEFGKKTSSGDIMNELPDRLSDVLMLLGAGYAIRNLDGAPYLGWAAALAAVLTAYVRTLGAWAGAGSDFSGVMAKQQRMALIAVACVVSMFEPLWYERGYVLLGALVVIIAGSAITVVTRTRGIMKRLAAR
jgi:phosphatidylglycerophosphate synthase